MTRILLVALLAASAGVHAALAAEHGLSFHVAAARLALAGPPRRPERFATFALAALIAVGTAAATPAAPHGHGAGTGAAPHGH